MLEVLGDHIDELVYSLPAVLVDPVPLLLASSMLSLVASLFHGDQGGSIGLIAALEVLEVLVLACGSWAR